MRHLLRRSDGAKTLVDADLWIAILDLGLVHGWRPRGTKDPDADLRRASNAAGAWQPLAYYLPVGQSIDAADARELAKSCKEGLTDVSETEVPFTGGAFGEEHTLTLLQRAAAREELPPHGAQAALEVLSGSPKKEASALLSFLSLGHLTIRPEPTRP